MREAFRTSRDYRVLGFLALLAGIALYFCYLLIVPFLKPIVCSAFIVILSYPLHKAIARRVHNKTLAATCSTSLVTALIALPVLLFMQSLLLELRDAAGALIPGKNGVEALGFYLLNTYNSLAAFVRRELPDSIQAIPFESVNDAARAASSLLAKMLGAFARIAFAGAISVVLLFFFFRDGRKMLRLLAAILPIRSTQTARLYSSVRNTLHAIVYGSLAVAAIQGALTGISFWVVGIASPVVWGLVTALCSLLPIIGTAFVYVPAAIMLLFGGHWLKALVLVIWGAGIVHPVDNFLRPLFIGGRTKLSTLYVFFALLGGAKVFGALGLFLGPIILALTVAIFTFLREEKRAGNWFLFGEVEANSSASIRERTPSTQVSQSISSKLPVAHTREAV